MLDYIDYDTRLAAYALIIEELDGRQRILLTLWNEGPRPMWGLPGGGIEIDESVEEGLVREIQEETGYVGEAGRLLGVGTHVVPAQERVRVPGRTLRSVRVYFTARVVGGTLANEVGGTTDEARWFDLAEIAGMDTVEQVEEALEFQSQIGNKADDSHVEPSDVKLS